MSFVQFHWLCLQQSYNWTYITQTFKRVTHYTVTRKPASRALNILSSYEYTHNPNSCTHPVVIKPEDFHQTQDQHCQQEDFPESRSPQKHEDSRLEKWHQAPAMMRQDGKRSAAEAGEPFYGINRAFRYDIDPCVPALPSETRANGQRTLAGLADRLFWENNRCLRLSSDFYSLCACVCVSLLSFVFL